MTARTNSQIRLFDYVGGRAEDHPGGFRSPRVWHSDTAKHSRTLTSSNGILSSSLHAFIQMPLYQPFPRDVSIAATVPFPSEAG
jgi:hypothetical protein